MKQQSQVKQLTKRLSNKTKKSAAPASTEQQAAATPPPPPQPQQRTVEFKVRGATPFLLLLFFFFACYGTGIYYFTSGFLLSRSQLDEVSYCNDFKTKETEKHSGCWAPAQVEKMVILVVDALRHSFAYLLN